MVGDGFGYINENNEKDFIYNYVDISYVRIIFDYGIVATIIVLGIYSALLVKEYKKQDYWMIFIIISVLIWSLIEPYIINIGRNIFVVTFIPFLEYGEIKILNYGNIINKRKK